MPERALAAVETVTLGELPLTRVLFAVRLLARRFESGWAGLEPGRSLYELMLEEGFVPLAGETGREVVFGVVGRFWSLRGGSSHRLESADDFLAFTTAGYAKATLSFRAEREGAGARLRTETRVVTTDPASRRAFTRYWLLIRPGSGLIRREWLRAACRCLERD